MSKTRLAFVIAVTASLAAVVAVGQAPGQTSEPEAERRRQLAELETLMALQATEQRQQQDQAAARAIVETRARQLAQRSLALRQTESELERVQAALRELEVSLELRTAELIETEQALRELRAELETVDESE